MSESTRELIEVLVSLAPYLLFAVALLLSFLAELRDDARSGRGRRGRPRR